MTQKRAAIYARISKKDKSVPKVANQIEICQGIAEDEGYSVDPAHIFYDDGIAASGKSIDDTTLQNRPGAQKLLAAAKAGKFDIIIVVEGERLARTYRDGLAFIDASVQGGVIWHLEADGILDPSTPTGEDTAMGIFASGRREGRVRTARQTRRYNKERSKGLPLWGVRPYGFEERTPLSQEKAQAMGWEWEEGALYIPVRPSEAAVIREAYEAYMAGEGLWSIAKRWTEAGIKTDKMGKPRADRTRPGETKIVPEVWVASTVRQVLRRPRNAGILMHNGVELPNSRIEPIVSREEWEALCAEVARRGGEKQTRGPKPTYLLSGILECTCGERMYASIAYSQRKGGPRHEYYMYFCRNRLTDKTQKHVSIQLPMANDAVIVRTLQRIAEGDLGQIEDEQITDALRSINAELVEVAEDIAFKVEILTDRKKKNLHAVAQSQLDSLEAQQEELRAQRDSLHAQRAEGGALVEFIEAWKEIPSEGHSEASGLEVLTLVAGYWAWEEMSLEKQREIIKGLFRVKVSAGGRGAGRIQFFPVNVHVALAA